MGHRLATLASAVTFLVALACVPPAQCVSVTSLGSTPAANLAASLVGPGITISNVTYHTSNQTAGFFTGGNAAFGIDSGIVLSTGLARGIVGSNSGIEANSSLALPGDSDLSALAGTNTYDATDLEFDFVPSDSTLYFRYVFSSDEYNQWIGQYNDVFAFYVDGTNVATLPNGTFVSVNNVNPCRNSEYFINNINQGTTLCSYVPPSANRPTAMNGMTRVLNVVTSVSPHTTHHMKLVIADVNDELYDSNVMIETGSLQAGGTPTPTMTPTVTRTPTVTPTFTETPTPYPDVHLYPNPFNPSLAARGSVKCENMRPGSSIFIYTVSGEKVVELPEANGFAEWVPRAANGRPLAVGIYYFLVRKEGEVYEKGVWMVTGRGSP